MYLLHDRRVVLLRSGWSWAGKLLCFQLIRLLTRMLLLMKGYLMRLRFQLRALALRECAWRRYLDHTGSRRRLQRRRARRQGRKRRRAGHRRGRKGYIFFVDTCERTLIKLVDDWRRSDTITRIVLVNEKRWQRHVRTENRQCVTKTMRLKFSQISRIKNNEKQKMTFDITPFSVVSLTKNIPFAKTIRHKLQAIRE